MSEDKGSFGVHGTGDTSGYSGLVRAQVTPGSSERPFGGYFDEVADDLERAFPAFSEAIEKIVVDRGELTLFVKRSHLVETALALRNTETLRFEMCMGVNGVHYPEDAGRELHAVYALLSLTHNRRIRIEVAVPDSDPHLPSLVEVWGGINWHERATWHAIHSFGGGVNPLTAKYLNRLSDLLFVLARVENKPIGDQLWVPGANR